MNLKRYFFFAASLLCLVFTGCGLHSPHNIEAVCEVTQLRNYVVKWEVTPAMEGDVSIYVSTDPEEFDLSKPVYRGPIADGKADIVGKKGLARRFFKLCFPNGQGTIVGVRGQEFASVCNFRDLGGYENLDHRTLKWGKIYRSGSLDSINNPEARRISRMNVKTLIDLRTPYSTTTIPTGTDIEHYYSFPITSTCADPRPLLLDSRFRRNDARIYMQDVFQDMLVANTSSLRGLFRVLQDEDSYPVIIAGLYGNCKTSLVAALLMYALDMPEQTVIDDYLLSNNYVNARSVSKIAPSLPQEAQSAVTAMIVSDELYLDAAFRFIERRFGSIDIYLSEEIGLDAGARQRLKSILLDDADHGFSLALR